MSSFPYTATTANVSYAVVLSDTIDLPGRITRLVVGTTGKIKFDTPHATGETLSANQVIALGEVLDFEVTRVYSAGTDASDIRAFGIFSRHPERDHHLNSFLLEHGGFLLQESPEFSHLLQE